MKLYEFADKSYLIEIKKVAGEYQRTGELGSSKKKVDTILQELRMNCSRAGGDTLEIWTDFAEQLDGSILITAHPRWNSIISYALFRAKSRRNMEKSKRRHRVKIKEVTLHL